MMKVVFHGLDASTHNISVNGVSHHLARDRNMFFASLEKFDPIYDPEPAPHEEVHVVEIPYTSDHLTLQW